MELGAPVDRKRSWWPFEDSACDAREISVAARCVCRSRNWRYYRLSGPSWDI